MPDIKPLPDNCPTPASGLASFGSQDGQHWFGVELRRAGWDLRGVHHLLGGLVGNQLYGWLDQDNLARSEGFA